MKNRKPGDSSVQQQAERVIREQLARELRCTLEKSPDTLGKVKLDGYCAKPPICVEIWAHQGKAKPAQKAKIMKDICKLLLAERKLGKRCRKIFAVADDAAVSHLENSWQGEFAKAFDIEIRVVKIDNTTREKIIEAQRAQYR